MVDMSNVVKSCSIMLTKINEYAKTQFNIVIDVSGRLSRLSLNNNM